MRILLYSTLLAMSMSGSYACSGAHDYEPTNNLSLEEAILGNWSASEIRIRAEWFSVNGHDEYAINTTFNQDHTYTATGIILDGEGLYTINPEDSTITVTDFDDENKTIIIAKIQNISRTDLELKVKYFSGHKDSVHIRFKHKSY